MERVAKEAWEERVLHPAASKAGASRGREHPEAPDPWRTCWERDRDRVVHCSAFRRQAGKTQVFVSGVGDHQRTRLTHSLEVQQVSRSLASALDLNEPLCEAVALAHDLGHPPYGHAAEELLDEKTREVGGFDHNLQTVRVVRVLESRSPDYPGLNLTRETLACLAKHQEVVDLDSGARLRQPLLEAQVVDLADSTAYHYHDVDDGIRAGVLDPEAMVRDVELWAEAVERVARRHPGLERGRLMWKRAVNEMLGMAIADVTEESARRLAAAAPASPRAAQEAEERLIGHSPAFRSRVARLHRYLYDEMYFRESVRWQVRRAVELLGKVFDALAEHPDRVPPHFREHADSTLRAVCDYVQGMTDRYVERIARELGVLPAY